MESSGRLFIPVIPMIFLVKIQHIFHFISFDKHDLINKADLLLFWIGNIDLSYAGNWVLVQINS